MVAASEEGPITDQRPQVVHRCPVDGREVAYRRRGAGPPVLLLHGITTSSFIWDTVIPHLVGAFDVVAVDLLGCGDSDRRLPADYSLKAHADRLTAVVDHLGWDRFHLVGHDLGGGISQIMAVGFPERLCSLTLVNTVGYDYWPVQPIVTMRTPVLRHLAMATLDTGMLRLIVRRGLYHKDRLTPGLMTKFENEISVREARRSFLNFARCLDNADLMEIVDRIRTFPAPTLLVRGDADVYLSPRICERLSDDFPSSRLVRVATAGHFIQIDEPELLAGHLMDHFRAHGCV